MMFIKITQNKAFIQISELLGTLLNIKVLAENVKMMKIWNS